MYFEECFPDDSGRKEGGDWDQEISTGYPRQVE